MSRVHLAFFAQVCASAFMHIYDCEAEEVVGMCKYVNVYVDMCVHVYICVCWRIHSASINGVLLVTRPSSTWEGCSSEKAERA